MFPKIVISSFANFHRSGCQELCQALTELTAEREPDPGLSMSFLSCYGKKVIEIQSNPSAVSVGETEESQLLTGLV